ncbi:RNA polymerase sigma factor [Vitreimonas flagellata]|uniref:RNA polymerase sigma factor n=1 Tax=Vitreimonas flagellata TaxID=2560861 RepID=UPI001074BCAC|nr:sigma-70 family RNA polymerase sigma factor [Vitreimonas flagellata]
MAGNTDQDQRYLAAVAEFGGAMQRLARATEANPERRRDLLQDMHVALWRSLATFDGRCALRTWVYRVAHNVAASHVGRERRMRAGAATLDEIEHLPDSRDLRDDHESNEALERLHKLIRALKPPDRQIITLYLEGVDAAAIADITGLSAGAVATRISRLKSSFAQHFQSGSPHD